MNGQNRPTKSDYMHWAKTHFHAKYNLATSGLTNYTYSELQVSKNDLVVTGDSYYGYDPLKYELGKRYNIDTEKIFFTLGTSFANFMVMSVMFEPNDEIIIEHPTYELLISTARYVGYKVKRFHRRFENNFQVDPVAIKKEITSKTKLILLTNLHNPSSVYTNDLILKEVGEIAESVGAYVFVDEVYLDSAFDINPHSSIHLGDNFIITNSLTKVYGLSGLRAGWVFASPPLIQKMWQLNNLFYVNHVHIAERLSLIALQNLDKIKSWARNILEQNHNSINSLLDSRNDLEIFRPGFGTVVFPRLKKGNSDDLSHLLNEKYNTAITPGKFFEMPSFFRIGLGCETEIFKKGIKHIDSALNDLRS